jgi:hypothetical protein
VIMMWSLNFPGSTITKPPEKSLSLRLPARIFAVQMCRDSPLDMVDG